MTHSVIKSFISVSAVFQALFFYLGEQVKSLTCNFQTPAEPVISARQDFTNTLQTSFTHWRVNKYNEMTEWVTEDLETGQQFVNGGKFGECFNLKYCQADLKIQSLKFKVTASQTDERLLTVFQRLLIHSNNNRRIVD